MKHTIARIDVEHLDMLISQDSFTDEFDRLMYYIDQMELLETEHEILQANIKRYFELETLLDTHDYVPSDEELVEYETLRKVLKEKEVSK